LSSEDTLEVYKELQRVYMINREMAAYICDTSGCVRREWQVLPTKRLNVSLRPPSPKRRKMSKNEAFENIQKLIIEVLTS
jgi:hypothetical protein